MQNQLTQLLGIKYPIIQGGMAWCSDAVLAAAVSEAGGAGIIGTGGRTAEWTRAEIRKAKQLTAKPFGCNILLQAPNSAEILAVVTEEKPVFVTTGAGDPRPCIEPLHAAGVKIIPVVPNTRLALRVADAGADAIVIEGFESGGHIGQQTTMALMENVLAQDIKIPVVVAGGISDGRAMAAALLMGAAGVQIGSLFMITDECPAHPAAKAAVCKAVDTDSMVTGWSRGSGVRSLSNAFTKLYHEKEISGAPMAELMKLGEGTNRRGLIEGDVTQGTVMVGQSLNVLNEIKPCAAVVEELMAVCRNTLERAPAILRCLK